MHRMTQPLTRPINRTVLTVPVLLSLVPLQGCLLSASRESEIRGAYVAPTAAMRVRLNATTTHEAEDLLGLPSSVTDNDDGSETWSWTWSKQTDSKGTVFILFSGRNESTVHESVHITFRDGVAVKKWRD